MERVVGVDMKVAPGKIVGSENGKIKNWWAKKDGGSINGPGSIGFCELVWARVSSLRSTPTRSKGGKQDIEQIIIQLDPRKNTSLTCHELERGVN